MSVATKNPFAILEEDPSRPTTPAQPPAVDPPLPPPKVNQKPKTGPAARGGRYYQRGGAPPKGDAAPQDAPAPNSDAPRKRFDGDPRGRGRGKGRGDRGDRHRAGADGEGRGRGRQFDKHSQTGKIDTDKRVHQTWGGDDGATELRVEEAALNDAVAESNNEWGPPAAVNTGEWDAPAGTGDWGSAAPTSNDQWAAPVSTDAPDAPAPEKAAGDRDARKNRDREPEEEDNTLTLTQYLAKKKESEGVPKLDGPRRANEGVDDNIWKDVVPLKKDEEANSYFVGKNKSTPKSRAKKEEKIFLEINAHFDRPSRGGRGRGGDRGDRPHRGGGRGRGGPRSRPNGAPTINVDDESAFPSLS